VTGFLVCGVFFGTLTAHQLALKGEKLGEGGLFKSGLFKHDRCQTRAQLQLPDYFYNDCTDMKKSI